MNEIPFSNTNIIEEKQNNYIRPYTSLMTQASPTIATIILYKLNPTDKEKTVVQNTDYLSDFSRLITNVETSSEDTSEGSSVDIKVVPKTPMGGNKDYYGVFNNFSLINVAESREQIVKIHNNFGGNWNAFFMGERPKIYSFSGFFLDSKEYPYYQEFLIAYDNYIQGIKAVELKYEMVLAYDGKLIKGYLLNLNTVISGEQPFAKNFTFTVLIQKESWIRFNLDIENKEQLNYMNNVPRLQSLGGISIVTANEVSTIVKSENDRNNAKIVNDLATNSIITPKYETPRPDTSSGNFLNPSTNKNLDNLLSP